MYGRTREHRPQIKMEEPKEEDSSSDMKNKNSVSVREEPIGPILRHAAWGGAAVA